MKNKFFLLFFLAIFLIAFSVLAEEIGTTTELEIGTTTEPIIEEIFEPVFFETGLEPSILGNGNCETCEDFTTYTEEDPNNRITVETSKVTFTNLTRAEAAYVYKDKGVDHFNGDFEHLLTVNSISSSGEYPFTSFWGLSNDIGAYNVLAEAGKSWIIIDIYHNPVNPRIEIRESDGGTVYYEITSYYSPNTPYYLKIKRDESVGTYGTLYCYIYSDAARTTLIDTLEMALHTSKKDYRYIYAVQSMGLAGDPYMSGYSENLDLGEEEPPAPPTGEFNATNTFFAYFFGFGDYLLPIFGFVLVVVLVAGILNFILTLDKKKSIN
jgi:hypothetical protein